MLVAHRGGEGLAAAARGEEPRLRGVDRAVREDHQADTAREGQVAVGILQVDRTRVSLQLQ